MTPEEQAWLAEIARQRQAPARPYSTIEAARAEPRAPALPPRNRGAERYRRAAERQAFGRGAADPRLPYGRPTQLEEVGQQALEATGLPSVRRSARAFASGDPVTGAGEGAMAALGVAGLGFGGRALPRNVPRAPLAAPAQAATEPLLARLPNAAREIGRASDGSVLPMRQPQPFRRTEARSEDLREAARMARDVDPLAITNDPDGQFQRLNTTPSRNDSPTLRMARAKREGFDTSTPWYHGTYRNDHPAEMPVSSDGPLGPGVYMTNDVQSANGYTRNPDPRGASSPNIIPLLPRGRAAPLSRWYATRDRILNAKIRPFGDDLTEEQYQAALQATNEEAIAALRAKGFTGVVDSTSGSRTVWRPQDVRSRFAAFDPRRSGESDLLASVAPVGIGLSGALSLKDKPREPKRNAAR